MNAHTAPASSPFTELHDARSLVAQHVLVALGIGELHVGFKRSTRGSLIAHLSTLEFGAGRCRVWSGESLTELDAARQSGLHIVLVLY